MTTYIILEGPDGGGHTLHAQYLSITLRNMGARARSWAHPKHPEGAVGLARVHHYIGAREAMDGSCDVLVMDRGPWSGVAHALAVEAQDPRRRDSGLLPALADAAKWIGAHVIYLDAPDDELDRRIASRGENPQDSWAERRAWRELADEQAWVRVSTLALPRETLATLTDLALRLLNPPAKEPTEDANQ